MCRSQSHYVHGAGRMSRYRHVRLDVGPMLEPCQTRRHCLFDRCMQCGHLRNRGLEQQWNGRYGRRFIEQQWNGRCGKLDVQQFEQRRRDGKYGRRRWRLRLSNSPRILRSPGVVCICMFAGHCLEAKTQGFAKSCNEGDVPVMARGGRICSRRERSSQLPDRPVVPILRSVPPPTNRPLSPPLHESRPFAIRKPPYSRVRSFLNPSRSPFARRCPLTSR